MHISSKLWEMQLMWRLQYELPISQIRGEVDAVVSAEMCYYPLTTWLSPIPPPSGLMRASFQKITSHLRRVKGLLLSYFRLPFALSPFHCKNTRGLEAYSVTDIFNPFYVKHKMRDKTSSPMCARENE